jgi:signal transduction histidine kinase
MLTGVYTIAIVYRMDERVVWEAGRLGSARAAPGGRHMKRGMRGMMMRANRVDAHLGQNRVLSIYLPMHIRKRNIFLPYLYLAVVLGLIMLSLFISLRKTLRPLDAIMEASERIAKGDLTYRIQHTKYDDFGKVAQAFNTMADKLSSMLGNQRDLLHFISHELRTPLARINLALEIKDRKKSNSLIKREVHDIDTLVGEILELSRMDEGELERSSETIDLVSNLRGVIKLYKEARIDFHTDVEKAPVVGNVILIQKAFLNLIDNAVKYSKSNDTVFIGLSQKQENFVISIENSGPGIAEKEKEKIWEPFFRGGNSLARNVQGRGLGLVIVKKAVKLSSGAVDVNSSTKGPTVFTIQLPRKYPSIKPFG